MNEELEYGRRARMRSLVLLVVVLLVGMLLGAASERYLFRRMPVAARDPNSYPGTLGRMDLTTSQRATIDSLIALERPRFDSIVQRVLPDLRLEADSMRAVVRAVLTPEQQRLFDSEPRAKGADLIRRFGTVTASPDTTP